MGAITRVVKSGLNLGKLISNKFHIRNDPSNQVPHCLFSEIYLPWSHGSKVMLLTSQC